MYFNVESAFVHLLNSFPLRFPMHFLDEPTCLSVINMSGSKDAKGMQEHNTGTENGTQCPFRIPLGLSNES